MYPWVVQLTFSWSCLMQKDFHDNEMRKLRLCSRNPQDWTAQALKRAYTGLNHTGFQARIYVYIYTWRRMFKPPLYIYYSLSGLQRFHIFFFYQTSLSHKLIQFIQDSQPSFFFSSDFKILIIKHRRLSTYWEECWKAFVLYQFWFRMFVLAFVLF